MALIEALEACNLVNQKLINTWIGRPSQAFPPRDPYVTVFRHTALTTTHLPRKKEDAVFTF